MKKIGSDKLTLYPGERNMGRESVFHFGGARLEYLHQVAVTALEIFQHVSQQMGCHLGIESENPVDDMVRSRLVGRIEVPRLGCRFEGPHQDPGWIRTQIESLSVQEHRRG